MSIPAVNQGIHQATQRIANLIFLMVVIKNRNSSPSPSAERETPQKAPGCEILPFGAGGGERPPARPGPRRPAPPRGPAPGPDGAHLARLGAGRGAAAGAPGLPALMAPEHGAGAPRSARRRRRAPCPRAARPGAAAGRAGSRAGPAPPPGAAAGRAGSGAPPPRPGGRPPRRAPLPAAAAAPPEGAAEGRGPGAPSRPRRRPPRRSARTGPELGRLRRARPREHRAEHGARRGRGIAPTAAVSRRPPLPGLH